MVMLVCHINPSGANSGGSSNTDTCREVTTSVEATSFTNLSTNIESRYF